MYEIISNGTLVALCDRPRYVKFNEDSGAYVEAAESEAIAISVHGDLYNINGGNSIPDAPQATVRQSDSAEYVFLNRARIAKNEEETNTAIIGMENALCEIDASGEERLTAIEDALCELDSSMEAKANE